MGDKVNIITASDDKLRTNDIKKMERAVSILNKRSTLSIWGFLLICCSISFSTNNAEGDYFEMSIEELMKIKVASTSCQKQSLSDAASPASIITEKDIHHSGLTNLYEILRLAYSIDMLQIHRNRYSPGIRELHKLLSDKTSAKQAEQAASELLQLAIKAIKKDHKSEKEEKTSNTSQ